ncbi:MAG: hypothetical protein ACP6IP_07780 [Candidatus Njordarchaeia archaeon]
MSSIVESLKTIGLDEKEGFVLEKIIQNASIPYPTLKFLTNMEDEELERILRKLENMNLVLGINGKYVAIPPLSLFIENLFNVAKDLKKITDKFASDTGGPIKSIMERLNAIQEDKFSKLVSLVSEDSIQEIKSMKEDLVNKLNEIIKTIEEIRVKESNLNKEITKLVNYLKENKEEFEKLTEFSVNEIREFIEKNKDTWGEEIERAVNEKLGGIMEIQGHLESFQMLMNKINEITSTAFVEIVKRMEGMLQALEKAVPELSIGITKAVSQGVTKTIEDLSKEFNQYINKVSKNIEDIHTYVVERLEKYKKDVKDGYSSVLEETYRNIEKELDYYSREFENRVKEINEKIIVETEERKKAIDNEIDQISKTFKEELQKIQLTPTAFDKAIMEATESITQKFYSTFKERMVLVKKLEEETWRWFSEKIIETADKIMATSDNLLLSYGDLLDNINKNLTILSDYILSLPNKIYSNIDREWRNFLEQGLDKFKQFVDRINAEITRISEETENDIKNFLESTLTTFKTSNQNNKEVLKQYLNGNLEKLESDLELIKNKIGDILKDENLKESNPELYERLVEINSLIEKTIKEYSEENPTIIESHINRVFQEREENLNKIFSNLQVYIDDKLKTSAGKLYETFTGLKSSYLEDLSTLIETVRIVYASHLEALNELISVIINKVKNKANDVSVEVEKIINKHSDDMVRIFRESTGVIKERIDTFLRSFEEELNEFPEDYRKGIEAISRGTKTMLENITKNMTKIIDESEQKIVKSLEDLDNVLSKIIKEQNEVYTEWSEKLLDIIINVETENKKFAKEGGMVVGEFIDTIFQEAIDMLNVKIGEIDEWSKNLLNYLTKDLNQYLGEYSKIASTNMTQAIDEFIEPIRMQIKQTRKELDETNSILQNLEKSKDLNIDQIIENVNKLKGEITKVTTEVYTVLSNKILELIETKIITCIQQRTQKIATQFNEIETKILGYISSVQEKISELNKDINIEKLSGKIRETEKRLEEIRDRFEEFSNIYKEITEEIKHRLESDIAKGYKQIIGVLEDLFLTINRYYIFLVNFHKQYEIGLKNTLKEITIINNKPVAVATMEQILKEASQKILVYINITELDVVKRILESLKDKKVALKVTRTALRELEKNKVRTKISLTQTTKNVPNTLVFVVGDSMVGVYKGEIVEGHLSLIYDKDFANISKLLFS